MSSIKRNIWLILFFVSLAYYAFLSYYGTFYRLGLFVIPLVFVITGLIGVAVFYAKNRSFKSAVSAFFISSTLIYTALSVLIKIDNYKPTVDVHITENYEGTVYLFVSKVPLEDVSVDDNGIGYIPADMKYDLQVYHGKQNISDVLNASHSNEISYPNADSTEMKVFYVSCFDVAKNLEYPKNEMGWVRKDCLSRADFDSLKAKEIVNTERLYFQIIKRIVE